ncbi:ABC transporter substrate-binding protein, partial [Psychromonas sp.]|nr:ABC transporter substrate-binding protein [Psychromonas sp.]
MLLRWVVVSLLFYGVSCAAQEESKVIAPSITIAIDNTPNTFNPFSTDDLMSQPFRHLLFDPLFRWGHNNQLETRLVEKWKRLDNKTVRFYLRQKVRFHSGNKLTTQDVIWSFEQAPKKLNSILFNHIESIKQRSSYSFDIKSDLSDIQLLDYLTSIFILDYGFYKKNIGLLNTAAPILLPPIETLPASGTGPYIVHQYNPSLGLEVEVNKKYWDTRPEFEYIRFMRVNKAQSRLFALLADDVQISYGIPNKEIDDIPRNTSKRIVKVSTSNAVFLTMNDKFSAVLKNEKAREAIRFAINQQGMLQHILKGSGRVDIPFLSLSERKPQDANEVSRLQPTAMEYNIQKSKKILKSIQLPKQLSMLVMQDDLGNTEEIAEALVQMLHKIGVQVLTQKTTSKDIWDKTNLNYDLTLFAWQTRLMNRQNIYENLFLNSPLTGYLHEKFKQQEIGDDVKLQAEYFELLQREHWISPLFSQDEIWIEEGSFNLQNIFSTNGIP